MFVWAEYPEPFKKNGLSRVQQIPHQGGMRRRFTGIGFGDGGDTFARFALVENEHRIRQAARGIKKALMGKHPHR